MTKIKQENMWKIKTPYGVKNWAYIKALMDRDVEGDGKLEKTAIVIIEGGVVQDVVKPNGCNVDIEIRDYDVDDDGHPSIKEDSMGKKYSEGIW